MRPGRIGLRGGVFLEDAKALGLRSPISDPMTREVVTVDVDAIVDVAVIAIAIVDNAKNANQLLAKMMF